MIIRFLKKITQNSTKKIGSFSTEKPLITQTLLKLCNKYDGQYTNILKANLTKTPKISNKVDKVLGSIIGAALGDAIGTTIEFERKVSDEQVKEALKCIGQGPFSVQAGQVTDDTEMAIEIAHGLMQNLKKSNRQFDLNAIAQCYYRWTFSPPFDIGGTTRNAFRLMNHVPWDDFSQYKQKMIEASKQFNSESESNGAIMRSSPLSVYGVFKDSMKEADFIYRSDVSLTHSNQFVQDLGSFYSLLIRELILVEAGGDMGLREQALEKVLGYAKENFKNFQQVQIWVENGKKSMNNSRQIGHIQLGFEWSIYCLMKGFSYEESLSQVLQMGGDTDTNGAIVCAVIGACDGFCSLPDTQYKVIDFDPNDMKNFNVRPLHYDIQNFIKYTGLLFETFQDKV